MTEHGGIAVLYNPCINPTELCRLREFFYAYSPGEGGPFRWVMTPYKKLDITRGLFIAVSFGHTYEGHCYQWPVEVDAFIKQHYRHGVEDIPDVGTYDYLRIDSPPVVCQVSASLELKPHTSTPLLAPFISLVVLLILVKASRRSNLTHL